MCSRQIFYNLCITVSFRFCSIAITCVCVCVCVACRRLVQNCSNITDLNLTGCRRITNVYVLYMHVLRSISSVYGLSLFLVNSELLYIFANHSR